MHLIALALVGASLLAAGGPTQPAPPLSADAPAQPAPEVHSLRFSPEILDLGEMVANKPLTGKVTVTNTTNAPLKVARIGAACGCTTVSKAPTDPVPAGESFSVEVALNPGMKTGVNLSKAVYFYLENGATQTLTVKGSVKTVVRVSPEVIDCAKQDANAITLESVDKKPFRIIALQTGVAAIALPTDARPTHTLSMDWAAWVAAGRPVKIEITTDKLDAEKLVVMIKNGPQVVMYRLPTDASSQDAAIHMIDERIHSGERSTAFAMKLHRETGMLFVHGTQADVDAVKRAVASLPANSGVHEAGK